MSPEGKEHNAFDTLAYYALLALIVAVPLAVVPSANVPFLFTKTALAALLGLLALMFFVVGTLNKRELTLPLAAVAHTVWLLPLAYFLSTLFSSTSSLSFMGDRLEMDTFAFMALAAVVFTLAVVSLRTRGKVLLLYFSLLGAFFVLGLYHVVQLALGPEILSLDVFSYAGEGPLGSVRDLGMFAGLVASLALMTIVGLRVRGPVKVLLPITLILALFLVMVANVAVVWWLLAFVALGSFVFSVLSLPGHAKEKREDGRSDETVRRRGPDSGGMFASLVVLGLSLAFLFGSAALTNAVGAYFGVGEVNVRPSWSATVAIARETLRENVLFGSGPTSFAKQWAQHRPRELNQTALWNVDFANGIGFIPTSVATTGLVGAAAWLVFLGVLLFAGVRTLLTSTASDPFAFYLTLSSFVAALYLWVLALVSTPSAVHLLLAFLVSGVFVATLRYHPHALPESRLSFVERPRLGFIAVLLLTILVLGSVASLFTIATRYTAAVYLQKGLVTLQQTGEVDRAWEELERSRILYASDEALRVAVNLDLARLNQIAAEITDPTPDDRTRFQAILSRAIENAEEATRLDPYAYQNWMMLGRVYAATVPLAIEGAYDNANRAFVRAEERRPASPHILLERARLEFAAGNRAQAKAYAQEARALRESYTEAIFLLAQLQIQEGNIEEAIGSVEQAVTLSANNPVSWFQLGLLYYADEQYREAVTALSRAIDLNEQYANARYFRGLALFRLGRVQDAVDDFSRIQETNPNNQEVARILANMEAGRDPFVDEAALTEVEQFDEPPLAEDAQEAPAE